MKKVLLLGGVGCDTVELQEIAKERDILIDFVGIQQLVCRMDDMGTKWFLRKHRKLDYDAVMVRGIQSNRPHRDSIVQKDMVRDFCAYMQSRGAVIIDPGFIYADSLNKVEMTKLLAEHNFPIVPSRFILSINGVRSKHLPCIVKPVTGSCGIGVQKISTEDELKMWQKQATFPSIMQPWIPNNSDMRVLVVGGKVATIIERKRVTGDVNNLSRGADGEEVDLPEELKQLAIRAAEVFGYDIAGVDLLHDIEQDKWYILEINRAPDWQYTPRIATTDVMGQIMDLVVKRIESR